MKSVKTREGATIKNGYLIATAKQYEEILFRLLTPKNQTKERIKKLSELAKRKINLIEHNIVGNKENALIINEFNRLPEHEQDIMCRLLDADLKAKRIYWNEEKKQWIEKRKPITRRKKQ